MGRKRTGGGKIGTQTRAVSAERAGVTQLHPLQDWANRFAKSFAPKEELPEKQKTPQTHEEILALYPVVDGKVTLTFGEFDTLLRTPRHMTALRQGGANILKIVPNDHRTAFTLNLTLCIKKEGVPSEWENVGKTPHDSEKGSILRVALGLQGKFILASRTGKLLGYGEVDRGNRLGLSPARQVHGKNTLEENFRMFVENSPKIIQQLKKAKAAGVPLFYDWSNTNNNIQYHAGTLFLPKYSNMDGLVQKDFADVVCPFLESGEFKPVSDISELKAIFEGRAQGIALLRKKRIPSSIFGFVATRGTTLNDFLK